MGTVLSFQESVSLNDTGNFMSNSPFTVNVATETFVNIGTQTPAKDPEEHKGWIGIFNMIGLPAGATINGCRIDFRASGNTSAQPALQMTAGCLHDDSIWSNGDGLSRDNYDRMRDLPWAEFNQGAGSDPDVWIDRANAAGTSVGSFPATTNGIAFSIGDGTGIGTPSATITGMTAHLQLAVDESGLADPTICWEVFQIWNGVVAAFVTARTCDHATPSHAPKLWIDFTPPGPTSSFVVVPQAQRWTDDMTVEIEGTFLEWDGTDLGSTTTWTDSVSGLLHTGATLTEADLTVGVHVITVLVTDSSALTDTTIFTITIYDVPTDLAAAIVASTVDGDPNTSLQIAGGWLSAGAGGGSGERGVAVIDALP
jgi:hypothetical protein